MFKQGAEFLPVPLQLIDDLTELLQGIFRQGFGCFISRKGSIESQRFKPEVLSELIEAIALELRLPVLGSTGELGVGQRSAGDVDPRGKQSPFRTLHSL